MSLPPEPRDASQSLGRYQLRKLLGQGGFGQVHEAWDPALQRCVAVKRLMPDLLQGQAANLIGEARLAASLRHPAFVQIYGLEDDGRSQSIVMELVDGKTLRQLLSEQSSLGAQQLLDIVCQLADAMEQAHIAGLVHGDLKPANLMIEPSGQLRIMDFGLARKIDPLATESASDIKSQGTVAYLAPETLLGKPPNQLSDIYAVGVLIYEMMHGQRPFAHLNGLALAAAHLQSSSAQWVFAAGSDPAMTRLVMALCAREPADRLPTMRAVGLAAGALRSGTGTQRGADGLAPAWLPPQLAQPQRRPRARTLAWCAAGLTACALGIALLPSPLQSARQWLPPYSDAASLASGQDALRHFDRDQSLDIAEENFKAILARRPGHAAAAAGLAIAYALRYAGDRSDDSWLQRADASAQLSLASDDQLAQGYAALSLVRQLQGRNDEGLQLAERALKLDPLNLFALNDRATILIRMRRFDEARRCIDEALQAYPNERMLIDQLGVLHFKQGDYAAAELAFRRSILAQPDAVFAYANLNAALLRQGRSDEALQILQQGLQIRPSGQLYSNLGTVLFNRGDYLGAAQAFQHAVSSVKGRGNAYLHWANLADTLRWIPGRETASRQAYQEAAALLQPLLAHSPSDTTYLSRMGLYAAKLGDKPTAELMSGKAVAAAPNSADVHFRAAMAYEIIGQRDAALGELGRAQQHGYPAKLISTEPDLLALRRDPRFHQPHTESK
ncbi:serine/threonine-protein kinase [Duganella sp. HH101]|uniref:serine/threonine-protein kinase n=1 Tax=Duganella sp. HH101 TaxID=1781066 RepID=UPI000892FB6F|nr:serine/threonine-protein kinase [Duganella sp. HH101]OFA02609.1 serine/threonine-protein kinase PknA [Duganella sp. HH101]